jgi:hypothetical protein
MEVWLIQLIIDHGELPEITARHTEARHAEVREEDIDMYRSKNST